MIYFYVAGDREANTTEKDLQSTRRWFRWPGKGLYDLEVISTIREWFQRPGGDSDDQGRFMMTWRWYRQPLGVINSSKEKYQVVGNGKEIDRARLRVKERFQLYSDERRAVTRLFGSIRWLHWLTSWWIQCDRGCLRQMNIWGVVRKARTATTRQTS